MGMLLNIFQKHNKTTSEGLFNYSALLLVAKVGLSPGNIAVCFLRYEPLVYIYAVYIWALETYNYIM